MRIENFVMFTGNIVADPEMRTTAGGKKVVTFSIGVSDGVKDENDNYTSSFFNCIAWEKTGELISSRFRKGNRISLAGQMRQRHWKNKEDKIVHSYEVNVETVSLLGIPKSDNTATQSYQNEPEVLVEEDGDMPF